MRLFAVVGFALVALAILLPRTAFAWVEMHVARDDVRVHVDRDGGARIEHKVLLLVSGGPLKSFTIRGVDADAALEEGAYVVPEKDDQAGSVETSVPLYVQRITDEETSRTDLVVDVDGGRGISRGRYVAVIRYRTNLVGQNALRIEGASARIDWVGPAWEDGLDATRAWFHLPSAKAEPKAIEPGDDDDGAGTFLSTLSRRPEADVLEVVRPYASRGERVVWSIRVDRNALTLDADGPAATLERPALPPDGRAPMRLVSSPRDTMLLVGALALFLIVASLVAAHGIEVRQRAERRDQKPRPLVGLPIAVRAIATALLFVAGLWLQLTEPSSFWGALVVAACVPLIWYRSVVAKPALRGPGAWLCIKPEEAFAMARPPARGVFEPTSMPGAIVLLLVVAGTIAGARLVGERSAYHGILIALDAIPLLALFVSGRASTLVPDPAVDSIPMLEAVVRRVQKKARGEVRVIPRVRIPNGQPDADELRIVFLPRDPIRGLRAIETAVAFTAGPGGYVPLPEVLLRFEESSACDQLVQHLEPYGRAQRGRRVDERVLGFVPKLPTARLTADLVLAILERTAAAPRPKNVVATPVTEKKRRAPARARTSAEASEEARSA
ncbi:MAG: hypothetical protein HOW73_26240 [Polyangiaceae bacterium]|nr:hypothetical protein [Polyangiaceae bacterium]